jgi:signal transduction histidine kinase
MTTIQRGARELLYSVPAALAGVTGFAVLLYTMLPGLALTVTILGTLVGLLLVTLALRLAGRFGALHRWLLGRILGVHVTAPPPFEPGTGILNRLDRRLRYRAGWRAVWYAIIKLPVAALQAYAVAFAICGLVDLTYPVMWVLFRRHDPGTHRGHMVAISPVPFVSLNITSWPGTILGALLGGAILLAGGWLARATSTADRRLIRGLLGPSSMAERVSQLERTRALAVDDSAAALRRVERDLHDGAQMRLAALAMNLGMAQEKLDAADDETVRELLVAAQRNASDALADLRDIARGIHPPVLDQGLLAALESLAASSAIPTTVSASGSPDAAQGSSLGSSQGPSQRPSPAIETIAYFCAAELTANATKHSYANQIKIEINSERADLLRLRVSDDGVGGADQARGSGLAGLAQRVSTVDGRIEVSSPPGGPTVVTVELPLRADGESGDK